MFIDLKMCLNTLQFGCPSQTYYILTLDSEIKAAQRVDGDEYVELVSSLMGIVNVIGSILYRPFCNQIKDVYPPCKLVLKSTT